MSQAPEPGALEAAVARAAGGSSAAHEHGQQQASSAAHGDSSQARPAGGAARGRSAHVIQQHPGMPALTKTLSGRAVPLSSHDHAGMSEVVRSLTQQSRASRQRSGASRGPAGGADGADANAEAEKQARDPNLPLDAQGNFDLEAFLRDAMRVDASCDADADADAPRAKLRVPTEMGLAWRGLTVRGVGAGATLGSTVGSIVAAPFNFKAMKHALRPPVREILHDLSGNVNPGEMLLVLGRPGSGCTTMLKTLASYRDGYKAVEGEVLYQGLDHRAIDGPLRGEVVYAAEDDIHFASLNVGRTLNFAIAARAPQAAVRPGFGGGRGRGRNTRAGFVATMREVIATTLGLKHTFKTPVGNELLRGISGGEKKRVSIAEMLASRARIQIYDNSTRGLDASTAIEFIQSLRILTNTTHTSTVCSIYQAGEPIFRLFDKVAVLYAGRCIYFGAIDAAVDYFIDMGYTPHAHQTSADFLVSVSDPHARILRDGFEERAPRTADEMEAHWRASPAGRAAQAEADAALARMRADYAAGSDAARAYIAGTRLQKAKHTRASSPFLLSYAQQVRLCIKRRAQIIAGDYTTQLVLLIATVINGVVNGTVFVHLPDNTSGFFSMGGVLFFALLFGSFLAQTETNAGYMQRPIVIRQKRFAMVHPSADAIANTLLDIPVRFVSILLFDILLYYIAGLQNTAGQFFVLVGTTALTTYVMVAWFRFLAAALRSEANAVMVGGLTVLMTALYAGYVIPRPSMVVWWRWLSYCNPIAFAFEILMGNQFRTLNVPCAQYVPYGPQYNQVPLIYKACTILGAVPGQELVSGDAYLLLSYGYTWQHARRNAGILLGFLIAFIAFYAIASEFQSDPSASGGVMVFKRGTQKIKDQTELEQADARAALKEQDHGDAAAGPLADTSDLPHSDDVFAWRNVSYHVTVKGGEVRRLLNDVSGSVQPGKMTALMGESGAGKTTLLNVLAQRVDVGVVRGEFTVNGRPLLASFQAQTGYCQQADTHLSTATVREALEFSAVLRQPSGTKEEKLAYVDEVIEMLEMNDWQNALVGEVGQGLSVEQRKRLTIGVELAAKPKLLLFLDEPTSGLDSQSAFSIVRFLRRLANAGQSILCTIHQPSGELFSQFDRLILLKKGGEVVYAGDIHNSRQQCGKLLEYFEERSGRSCGDNNPAEFILDCIGAGAAATTDKDWHAMYKESQLHADLEVELAKVLARRDDPKYEPKGEDLRAQSYSTNIATQFSVVLKRTIVSYYRNPVYVWAKFALNIFAGLFVGSSFYGQGQKTSLASLQNQLFAVFIALVLSTSLAQQLQPTFIQMYRDLFEARERQSRTYRWPVLIGTVLLVEIPYNIVGGTLFWIPWQFFIMFKGSRVLMWVWIAIVFEIYYATFALAMAAAAPNAVIAAVLFSTVFSFVIVFCGVVQPPPILPAFWRSWMYPLTPFRYLIEGILGNVFTGSPIRCADEELTTIQPPPGLSCNQYLGGFSRSLQQVEENVSGANFLSGGYYLQEADGSCGYCQYSDGSQFLVTLDMDPSRRYVDFAILLAGYCIFNILLFFAFMYLFRIARWRRGGKTKRTLPSKKADSDVASSEKPEKNAAGSDSAPQRNSASPRTSRAPADADSAASSSS